MTDFDAAADKAHPDPDLYRQDPDRLCVECDRILIGDEECRWHFRCVCSWCKLPMKATACDEAQDGNISHGICKQCEMKFISEMEKQK